uniref:Secreted protein n=1 Tax=Arundo donax TaxID=35708 RepID=A0A0A9GP05_ARUDO
MERFLLLGLVQALLMLLKRRVTKQWLHFGQQLDYFLDVICQPYTWACNMCGCTISNLQSSSSLKQNLSVHPIHLYTMKWV